MLEKAGWVAEHVCAEVPHRQFVFTIPKRLRIYFRFDRRLLGDLCRATARTVITVYRAASGRSHPAYSGRRGQARVVLFGFSDGQELSEHTSTQHALVQVLSGECEFSLEGTWHTMKPGSWLHMPPGVRHAVRATGAFSMVLTLVKPPQAVGVCS